MNLPTSIRTCFEKTFDFTGRASRSEYWWFALFFVLMVFIEAIIVGMTDAGSTFAIFVSLGSFLVFVFPLLSVACRRLHDSGKSGWWQLLWAVLPTAEWIVDLVDDFLWNGSFSYYLEDTLGSLYWIHYFVITVIWLYFMCRKSDPKENKYGDSPLKITPAP